VLQDLLQDIEDPIKQSCKEYNSLIRLKDNVDKWNELTNSLIT